MSSYKNRNICFEWIELLCADKLHAAARVVAVAPEGTPLSPLVNEKMKSKRLLHHRMSALFIIYLNHMFLLVFLLSYAYIAAG